MQEAINQAYKNPTMHANCVPSKGEVPTIEEFIDYSAKRVKTLQEIKVTKEK